MSEEKKKVYCSKCGFYAVNDSVTIFKLNIRDYDTFPSAGAACGKIVDEYSTPHKIVKVCGNLMKLNINNNCPHYEKRPMLEVAAKAIIPDPRPWWKFWRSKGE